MSDAKYFVRKNPYATEQITVSSAAVTGTAALIANTAGAQTDGSSPARWAQTIPASAAIIEVATNGIYYTVDGTTPSSTNGHRLNAGDVLTLSGRQKIGNLKMIRQSADSVVNVTYYKD